MKKLLRLLSFAFAVLLLLGTSGCKSNINTSPEFTFGTDAWRGYYTFETHTMTESEDSYYYIDRTTFYAHVIDKESMLDTVLCAKPNCLHDQRSITSVQQAKECNGYVEYEGLGGIFYYNGHLYTVERSKGYKVEFPVLTQLSLDGTSQKVIWEFENFNPPDVSGSVIRYVFHRGVLYFIFNVDAGEEAPDSLYAYDTTTKKCSLLCESDRAMKELRVVGNALYIRQNVSGESSETDLLCYDITTKTTSVIPRAADVFDCNGKKLLYYFEVDMETITANQYFTCQNFDGTGEEPLGLDISQDTFKYPQTDGSYVFVAELSVAGDGTVKVYDLETQELVTRLPIPENMLRDYFLMCSLDGKLFLYSRFGREEKGVALCYGEIDKIATGDFEWKPIERIEVEIDF